MKKMSNTLIVLCILGFTAVGVLIQAVAIKYKYIGFLKNIFNLFFYTLCRSSFTFKRNQLDQVSLEAHKLHTAIRADVENHDRIEQLDRVLDRLKKRQ